MIRTLARAVIVHEGRVLLAQPAGADFMFLPGGHVECGECAADALQRELLEETGQAPTVGACLGAIECVWPYGQRPQHELNLLFDVDWPERVDVTSREPHLTFAWVNLRDLDAVNLLPVAARTIVRGATGGLHSDGW